MGFEGHPQAITPNMDNLARKGVRFARAYTQNPICTPSCTSILSGQYVHNHGYYGLCGPTPVVDLPSVLQQFRRDGYRTGIVGKVHTPDEPTNWLAGHCDTIVDVCTYHGKNGGEGKPYGDFLDSLGLRSKEDSGRRPEFPGNQQNEARPPEPAVSRIAGRFHGYRDDSFHGRVGLSWLRFCANRSERVYITTPSGETGLGVIREL